MRPPQILGAESRVGLGVRVAVAGWVGNGESTPAVDLHASYLQGRRGGGREGGCRSSN
jgi:hypothetical protein